jgi:hypothetical protein
VVVGTGLNNGLLPVAKEWCDAGDSAKGLSIEQFGWLSESSDPIQWRAIATQDLSGGDMLQLKVIWRRRG